MFPTSPTSLPLLLHQNQNQDSSFSFEDMMENYQPTDQDSSTPLNFDQTHNFCTSYDEQNPVLHEMEFADYFSTNMHFQTADSCSQFSDNISSFMPQPKSFNIDADVMRERVHARSTLALRMKTKLEVVDDGYKWRKYGKKKVKSSPYPRNYFKCSAIGCNVKKRIERDGDDSSYVITTYHGVHHHPR